MEITNYLLKWTLSSIKINQNSVGGIGVVSSNNVLAVVEVKKKLRSAKDLIKIRRKNKETENLIGRPVFLVSFRDYTRDYKNSLKGKCHECCFFMVNRGHHIYPWDEEMWPDDRFVKSSYSREFERLIKELSEIKSKIKP